LPTETGFCSIDSLRNQGRPKGSPERFALPVAGDDQRAKDVVIGLIEEIGFDEVDPAGLDASWRQQPGVADGGRSHALGLRAGGRTR
jgi:8-hydroxy-5-deazaflavin:NADPH oxidoreductase